MDKFNNMEMSNCLWEQCQYIIEDDETKAYFASLLPLPYGCRMDTILKKKSLGSGDLRTKL